MSVPEVARVKSYVTLERNGFVFLWYHAEGVDPVWEPPDIDEIASGQWKYCGRSEHHINAHIEVATAQRADVVTSKCTNVPQGALKNDET